jgi:hypothetical protein
MSSPEPETKLGIGTWVGLILIHALFAVIGLLGLFMLASAPLQIWSGKLAVGPGLIALLFSATLTAIGFGFFYLRYVKQPLWDAREKQLEERYPGQPWMLRKDWAQRRVVYSEAGLVIFLWVWSIGWCGGISFIARVNHDKIAKALAESYWNYALLALFVGAGILGLWFAVGATLRYWRYGRSVLRIDTLPAYAGDRFRGTVTTNLPARTKNPLKVELVCENLRWVTHGYGKNRRTELKTEQLRRFESSIAPTSMLSTRTGLSFPLDLEIPGDAEEVSRDSEGNGIRWMVHIATAGEPDPSFSCGFEIPVYHRR